MATVDIVSIGKLAKLRVLMQQIPMQAYLVPSVDFHQSEYVSPVDRRLAYVSNFTGSRGMV